MQTERTIARETTADGIGLHSGAFAQLRLKAAPAGSGILFRRVDLDGFVVEAKAANIANVSYATSLMKKGVFISTTEHLLSALIGLRIDNVVAEIDNLELPILDGSALPFLAMIDAAHSKQQNRTRRYLKIKEPVELSEGQKFIGVYPASSCKLHYKIDFPHPVIGKQSFDLDLTPESYRTELAPARTFGFLADVPAMQRQGLIRGGSMDSAVVLDEHRVINGELRYRDEFVRHKMLDLIGDLALLGGQILGEVAADRAGHAMHTALVRRLMQNRGLWESVEVDETDSTVAPEALPPPANRATPPARIYTD